MTEELDFLEEAAIVVKVEDTVKVEEEVEHEDVKNDKKHKKSKSKKKTQSKKVKSEESPQTLRRSSRLAAIKDQELKQVKAKLSKTQLLLYYRFNNSVTTFFKEIDEKGILKDLDAALDEWAERQTDIITIVKKRSCNITDYKVLAKIENTTTKKTDSNYIRPAWNAWTFFQNRTRSVLKKKFPDLEARQITEKLSEEWRNIKENKIELYNRFLKEAKADKLRYEQDIEDFTNGTYINPSVKTTTSPIEYDDSYITSSDDKHGQENDREYEDEYDDETKEIINNHKETFNIIKNIFDAKTENENEDDSPVQFSIKQIRNELKAKHNIDIERSLLKKLIHVAAN